MEDRIYNVINPFYDYLLVKKPDNAINIIIALYQHLQDEDSCDEDDDIYDYLVILIAFLNEYRGFFKYAYTREDKINLSYEEVTALAETSWVKTADDKETYLNKMSQIRYHYFDSCDDYLYYDEQEGYVCSDDISNLLDDLFNNNRECYPEVQLAIEAIK